MSDWAQGLRVAKGDRLVDVIRIWGFRISLEADPDRVLAYLSAVLPELLRLLDDPATDLGMRGAIAEALAAMSTALEAELRIFRQRQDARLAQGDRLRALILQGYGLCLEHSTALSGLVALARALPHLEPTPEVLALARRLGAHPAPSLQRTLLEQWWRGALPPACAERDDTKEKS